LMATENDTILVFGSFTTVSSASIWWENNMSGDTMQ
jgi:hypothetical protein